MRFNYKNVMLMLIACVVKLSFLCSVLLIEHSCLQDKSISGFISYALCAADEALRDANWLPSEDEKERTVRFSFCAILVSFILVVLCSWGLIGAVSGSLDWRRDWKHL